jgi:hypothetical protein
MTDDHDEARARVLRDSDTIEARMLLARLEAAERRALAAEESDAERGQVIKLMNDELGRLRGAIARRARGYREMAECCDDGLARQHIACAEALETLELVADGVRASRRRDDEHDDPLT